MNAIPRMRRKRFIAIRVVKANPSQEPRII
jgi:hypothetical protein